jgi:hypothetical protein
MSYFVGLGKVTPSLRVRIRMTQKAPPNRCL